MGYTVKYDAQVVAELKKLPSKLGKRIVNKINWLAENLEQVNSLPLSGNLSGFYKLRVGDYRVIYSLDQNSETIIIEKVGHRREIYKS
ncbi:type II toxin-antitoxin system RelE family toxin [Dactylococcopsis salina]|uniref:Addiction module toxin, RelE/StbE family n=1 Tax=Dactylococcopsis salina (strain PCC 8305) TaxID=13035 RepID=K9YY14_DACS8|nr:type II toxin-antitoxin system RelE/ParE family toxin [Dactylococcopsis salina]AFZ51008.1 addiction module toxin, RelE/StbE family [Dactylococcopsis salina PCC 8305]